MEYIGTAFAVFPKAVRVESALGDWNRQILKNKK